MKRLSRIVVPLAFAFVACAAGASPAIVATTNAAELPHATVTQRWLAYLDHISTSTSDAIDVLDDLQFDLTIYDLPSTRTDAGHLRSLATSNIRWLDAHKPAACYRSAWTYERSEWTHTKLSAQYLINWVNTGRLSWLTRSTSESKIATRQTKRATAAIDAATC